MTVVERAPIPAVVRRIVRRGGRAPLTLRMPVPQLRVARAAPTTPPTLWMITPHYDRPSGGIRKQYRVVDALNELGLPAVVVHDRAGFGCSWFEHETRVVAAGDVVVGAHDLIVVPEVYGPAILDLPRGVRQIIFNQNPYVTLDSLVVGGAAAAAPYVENPDLAAVVAVSDDSVDVLRHAFPGATVKRIRHGLDPTVHHPPRQSPGRRIAYMPRRRAAEAAQVLRLLELRGALDGWELVPIDGRSESEVALLLRSSRIFLSFSEREGFGLPPWEALACGCLVVGFDGFAGREYFRKPFASSVQDGDVLGFARAAEELIRRSESEPDAMRAAAEAGARFIADRYSQDRERRDLVDVFGPLLQP